MPALSSHLPSASPGANALQDAADRLVSALRRIRRRGCSAIVSVDITGPETLWCLTIDGATLARERRPDGLVAAAEGWLQTHGPRKRH